jgi:hypothetical protein
MPNPSYTLTLFPGATLDDLYRQLTDQGMPGDQAARRLFGLAATDKFQTEPPLPRQCFFLPSGWGMVVQLPNRLQYEAYSVLVLHPAMFDPSTDTGAALAMDGDVTLIFGPPPPPRLNYLGPTPEEQIEREERKAWEAREQEQAWEQEQREAQEQAAREAEERAMREAQDRAMREAQEAQERLGPEIHEAPERGEWGPIIDAPVNEDDDSEPPAAETTESESSSVVPFSQRGAKRGPKETKPWAKIGEAMKKEFPDSRPPRMDLYNAILRWAGNEDIEMAESTIWDGIDRYYLKWFPEP